MVICISTSIIVIIRKNIAGTKGAEDSEGAICQLRAKGTHYHTLKLTGINKDMNSEIFIQFWSVAIIGVIEWWVKNSMPYSSEEISEHLFNILSRNEVI